MTQASFDSATLDVSAGLYRLGQWVHAHPQACIRMGNWESKMLALPDTPVKSPVYVCGLARSGSTLLLELLASHPAFAAHRYADFPFIFTPYWWNTVQKLSLSRRQSMSERAHGDGMLVSPQSPEALEEMLWMAFFPHLHTPSERPISPDTHHPAFERFYKDHIRKMLLARGRSRYLAKGNYNIARLPYLHRLFPDARFIVPVRRPKSHIGSLMRQHERFCSAGSKDPRIPLYMRAAGHCEFGLLRTPLSNGDEGRRRDILAAWQAGKEVQGWALYWDMVYGGLLDQLVLNSSLRAATLIVPFESLCEKPLEWLTRIAAHINLPGAPNWAQDLHRRIKAPDYYQPTFTAEDKILISEITDINAQRIYG